ncbi:unnamed protein product [Acanthoscelides obtectus]|uniref:Actin-related protein 6 n=1 Tax=Acanthoscelides obtectus TaxID=200917 RepID=A0A9P0LVM9_ACAOB|nr:unnamed protein product [Acanthoscelides obtectus]CAK1668445.1 Actin-related protein 6 [Acanthoscelides obtectus]
MKAKAERKRLFIGDQINECRDCSGLYFLLPCERGYITKWDVQKPIWDYVFSKKVCPIDEHPVVLTQPLFNFNSIQDCIDEIFFEEYEVSSMFRLNPTDLAYLKYTRDHRLRKTAPCMIIDTGFSFTHIIPYINGNKYLSGVRRLNVGGKLLTNHLKDIISYRQYNVMEETYVINQVKEDSCYVAQDVKKELSIAVKSGAENNIVRNYVLPDFNNIRRGYILENNSDAKENEENCQILRLNNERFIVPEILFHPSDIGMKSMGIAEAVVKSILCCPKKYQQGLAKNVVVTGGNCNFKGFKERILAEVRSMLPHLWEVNVYQPDDPITYSWEGGKSLLKMPDFKSSLVTKGEYEELGSAIVQQRFNTWMTDNSTVKEEPPEKNQEDYRYLDWLKSRTVFGKEDPVDEKDHCEQEDDSKTQQNSEENDGNNVPENVDIGQQPADVEPKTKASLKNLESIPIPNNIKEDDQSSLDFSMHNELFPLGLGSYL